MERAYREDHHLAVMTDWALLGSIGLCFIVSGFSAESILSGVAGTAMLLAAFAVHVTLNWIYRTGFSRGQVALAFVVLILSMLSFVVSWIALPDFGLARAAIGILAFTAIFGGFATYMFVSHGMRGTFEMIDEIREL